MSGKKSFMTLDKRHYNSTIPEKKEALVISVIAFILYLETDFQPWGRELNLSRTQNFY